MKVRTSFVSNSSSSSFVVMCRKADLTIPPTSTPPSMCISEETANKLLEYGFKFTNIGDPTLVDVKLDSVKTCNKLKEVLSEGSTFENYDNVYLTYSVVCNQDFVIYFLLKNKIPFTATCHYDEELVFWDGKTDYYVNMANPLNELYKKGSVDVDNIQSQKINISEWLANEEKIWKHGS